MNAAIDQPLMRYHGSKFRIADWIRSYFPPHRTYVEPFGGGASVLFGKPRSPFEVYNDLDDEIVNVFRVLREPTQAERLIEQIALTPYARVEFDAAWEATDDPVERARRTLFRATASFGSAGATRGRTGFRSYSGSSASRGGVTRGPNPSGIWARYPGALPAFCERLQRVLIESRPAEDLLRAYDAPDTLFYLDPPYLHETRALGGGGQPSYRCEMTDTDHARLLELALGARAMVVLSGYPSKLYEEALAGWERRSRASMGSGNRGGVSREEVLWINPRAWDRVSGDLLFEDRQAGT